MPSLSVIFRETDEVRFNEMTSKAWKQTLNTFDLSSPENKQTLSFVTYRQVNIEVIPELERNLINLEGELLTANSMRAAVIHDQITTVNATLDGWNEILAEYGEINAKASEGTLENIGEWFQADSTLTGDGFETPQAESQYSILPEQLSANPKDLDATKDILVGDLHVDKNKLKDTGRFLCHCSFCRLPRYHGIRGSIR